MANSSKRPQEEPRISFKATKPVRAITPEIEEEERIAASAVEIEPSQIAVESELPDEAVDEQPRLRPASIKGLSTKRTISRNISLDKRHDEMLFDLQLKISRHFNQRCKVSDLVKAAIEMFSSMPMSEIEKHLSAYVAPRGRSRR